MTRSWKSRSVEIRRRTAWLLALCAGTELLIFDEPTAGLDPVATEELLQLIVARAAEGAAVLSTHQLVDVEQVADHIAIVDRGRTLVDAPCCSRSRCRCSAAAGSRRGRGSEDSERTTVMIRALWLCRRHLSLALWLLGTLLYGAVAGTLLHERPYVAGAVLAAVWIAAIWRGAQLA